MDNLNIAELMPLIAKLSENPAALSAISGLMGSMGKVSASQPPSQEKPASPQGGSDALSAIMGLMNSFQGGSEKPPEKPRDEARGHEKGQNGLSVGKIFGSQEEIKNRIILLNAVRPYLSEERRERLETVIKLLKLAELGALGSLLGGNQ